MVWSQYSILNIVIHGAQTPKYKIVYVNHLPEYCPVMYFCWCWMFGWKDGATEELLRCNSVQTIDFRGLESGLELSSVSSDSGLEHYSVSVCPCRVCPSQIMSILFVSLQHRPPAGMLLSQWKTWANNHFQTFRPVRQSKLDAPESTWRLD